MGVCGSGKSTIGRELARALGADFIEGDEFHPPSNVALMASGTALTDEDRQGWLQALAGKLGEPRASAQGVVLACSALKRSYRDILRRGAPGLVLVHLHGAQRLLESRLNQRVGHYMPMSLLQSQLDTLEAPGVDEAPIVVDIAAPNPVIVADLQRLLRERST
jgi:gluconokinase